MTQQEYFTEAPIESDKGYFTKAPIESDKGYFTEATKTETNFFGDAPIPFE